MAMQWFQALEGHMDLPYELVLDEAQCTEGRGAKARQGVPLGADR